MKRAAVAMAREKAEGQASRISWRFVPFALLILAVIAFYAMGWHDHLTLSSLAESRSALIAYVDAYPMLASTGFVLLYALAVAASFPIASLLTIIGGFLFGWLLGGTLVVLAATAGATALFLAARTAFGSILRQRIGGRASQLAKGFEEGAFGYLLVLRLAPVFPFWMINIAPAFFNVRLKTFVAATVIGIAPATFAYAYLGQGLESVIIAASASGKDLRFRDLVTPELTFAFAALAIVALVALIVKKMRVAS